MGLNVLADVSEGFHKPYRYIIYKGVRYSEHTKLLELQKENEELKNKIAELEEKIEDERLEAKDSMQRREN